MNAIYQRSKIKRKYHRKPPCDNLLGLCTFEKCHCFMAIKAPKKVFPIDKYLHHREKVVWRMKALEKLKNDIENQGICTNPDCASYPDAPIVGEYSKQNKEKRKYRNMSWLAVFIIPILVLGYILAIIIMDLFY